MLTKDINQNHFSKKKFLNDFTNHFEKESCLVSSVREKILQNVKSKYIQI